MRYFFSHFLLLQEKPCLSETSYLLNKKKRRGGRGFRVDVHITFYGRQCPLWLLIALQAVFEVSLKTHQRVYYLNSKTFL